MPLPSLGYWDDTALWADGDVWVDLVAETVYTTLHTIQPNQSITYYAKNSSWNTLGHVGQELYIQEAEPTATAPHLWVKTCSDGKVHLLLKR